MVVNDVLLVGVVDGSSILPTSTKRPLFWGGHPRPWPRIIIKSGFLMGVTGFDMARGSKIDSPLGSVTATKTTANEEYAELPMAA